jgi:hypothetical protein
MDLKIVCNCGQKIAFEVEPVNGRIPMEIECPVCNANITALGDEAVAQQLAMEAMNETPPPLPVEETPVVAAPEPAPEPAASPASGLKLRMAHRPEPKPEPEPAPASLSVRKPAGGTASSHGGISPSLAAIVEREERMRQRTRADQPRYLLGTIGAIVAGTIAMFGWFFLIKITRMELGIAAWGVGLFTGLGAKIMCRHTTPLMGIVAALCAFVAIIGGQFLAGRAIAAEEFDKFQKKMAVNVGVSGVEERAKLSEQEIREEIAFKKSDFDKGVEVKPDQITADEVNKFRSMTAEEIQKEFEEEMNEGKAEVMNSFVFQLMVLKESVGLFTLLWLFFGVGSAYKLASYGIAE